jgi:hypothetical protein
MDSIFAMCSIGVISTYIDVGVVVINSVDSIVGANGAKGANI